MSLAEAENRDAAARVRRLNDRVIRDLEPLLGEEHGRRVRMAYLERVTAGVIRADPLDVERVFSRLLESDRFDAENREILIGLRRSHRTTDDRHVDRLASSLEELESLVGPTEDLQAARDPETPLGARLAELRQAEQTRKESRTELARVTLARLLRLVEELDDSRLISIVQSGGRADPTGEDRPEYSESTDVRDPDRVGRATTSPIASTDGTSKASGLDWRGTLAAGSARHHYDDYLEAWTSEVAPVSRLCSEAHAAVFTVDPETMLRVADIEPFRDAYAHARDGAIRSREIEDRFFDDLSVALNEDQQGPLLRSRYARSLDRCLRGTDPFFSPSEMGFRPANVIEVIEGLPLSVETLAEVDEHLLRRGPALLESAAVARDIRMSSELALHEMNIRMSEGMSSGALTSADHGMAYRRLSEQMAERNGEAVAAWKLAHESFRDGLRDLLDPEEVSLFEAAWDVASNPIVYRDQNDSGPALDRPSHWTISRTNRPK